MKNEKLYKLTLTALTAALSYVVFTFLQIKVFLPGGDATSFHLGNAVCVLGALLLGGVYGGLGGAIGMTLGDLFDPIYVIYAPRTFFTKFCIGLVTGIVAHRFGHISTSSDKKHIFRWSLAASVCGMLFNFIFDPLIGYVYKRVILGKAAADVTLAWSVATTGVNAVLSVIAAVLVYHALRPALIRSGLFLRLEKKEE